MLWLKCATHRTDSHNVAYVAQKSEMFLDSVVLTAPPAVDLSLQPGDGVFQRLVLLLLFLPLVLPLLSRQLHIQTHCVLDRLCPGETGR